MAELGETMSSENNLLIQLHKWAQYQDENFTTDAFAHLLRYLLKEDPPAGTAILDTLTGGSVQIHEDEASRVAISTQEHTEDHGIPDISITGSGFEVLVEVKVGAAVDQEQLEDYLEELATRDVPTTQLVLLTAYAPGLEEDFTRDVHAIRWHEVADALGAAVDARSLSETSRFLVSQFLGFLRYQEIVVERVQPGVAAGLEAYSDRTGEDSIFLRGVRSPGVLAEEPQLTEFHALLVMMDLALTSVRGFDNCRLVSGHKEDEEGRDDLWVGYSVDRMAYYFYVNIRDPEVLIFQRFKGGVDPTTWDNTTGWMSDSYGKPRWSDQIDLASPDVGFFTHSKAKQVEILEEFLARSLAFARTLDPAPSQEIQAQDP